MPRIRTLLAAAAFLAIAAGAFQPFYVQMYFVDTAAMRTAFEELPYRKLPGLRRLALTVDAQTPDGARIALYVPGYEWGDAAYGYAFRRVPFLLAHKRVLPMLESDRNEPTLRFLRDADYVACWHGCPPLTGFRPQWRTVDGELMVRAR